MKYAKTIALLMAIILVFSGIFGGTSTRVYAMDVKNIALGAAMEVSASENASSWPGSAMVDGIKTTDASRWSSGTMSATTPHTPQWVIMDLGATKVEIQDIVISFYKKVWATDYKIQTCDTKSTNTTDWETLYTKSRVSGSAVDNVEDTFNTATTAKRYLRFYFTGLNTSALWNALSIREIVVNGTRSEATSTTAAKELAKITSLENPTIDSDSVQFPKIADGYTASLKGSDIEGVITNNGRITLHNIGTREVDVIIQVVNNSDPSDKAEKSMVIPVPDKTSLYPGIYPEVIDANKKPEVIPSLQEWYGYTGNFEYTSSTRIILNDQAGLGLTDISENMKKVLMDMAGWVPEIITGTATDVTSKDIYIESLPEDTYNTGDEGYYMVTDENGLRIYAPTHTGCLYGTITVEQILYQNQDALFVPCGVIRDYPKFQVRGLMLDVGRIPFRYQALENYVKTMAWYKMSELHLHISDNFFAPSNSSSLEAWENVEAMFRLESDLFPGLNTDKHTGAEYDYYNNIYGDPHYTKEQWVNLQALGESLGVNVITEIDAPGHSAAFTKYAYNNPDEITWLGPDMGIQNERNWEQLALVGANAPRALKFMTTLLNEYTNPISPTFTSDIVHVGADEYWNATADEKVAMAEYIKTMHNVLKANGKQMRMWAHIEPYLGGLSDEEMAEFNDIQLDVWCPQSSGGDNTAKRLAQGFELVNVDNANLYNTPLRNRRDTVNAEDLYETWSPYTLTGGVKVAKGEPGLIGAKTAVWGDVNRQGSTEKDIYDRATRAIAIVSEKTWGAMDENNMDSYEDFTFRFYKLNEGSNTELTMNIPSKSSVVADYNFENVKEDESGKTLYDASGNNYNAQVNGGTIVEEDGVTYLKFDSNTTITTPLKTLSYPYTVSFDLKVKADDKNANTSESSLFAGYDGRLQIAAEDGEMYLNRSIYEQSLHYKVPENEKVNITIVGTYQTTKIYVGGSLYRIMYRANDLESDKSPDNLVTTFCFPLETIGDGFNGYMANIKAYNKALSPEIIAGLSTGESVNIAQNSAAASDAQRVGQSNPDMDTKKLHVAWKAVDGDGRNLVSKDYTKATTDTHSKWMGFFDDTDSLTIDLGGEHTLSKAMIQWNAPGYATAFKIQISSDGENWTDSINVTNNTSDLSELSFEGGVTARYVKMQGVSRNGTNGYSIQEFEIYEAVDKSELISVCAQAERLFHANGITYGSVTEEYKEVFEAAVYAQALKRSPMAEDYEVKTATLALTNALVGFDIPDAIITDKTELTKTIELAESKTAEIYTVESINKLNTILIEAKRILVNENAIQTEIDEIIVKLKEGIQQLVEKETNTEKVINLALNQPVTESGRSIVANTNPENAVDGNTTTRWEGSNIKINGTQTGTSWIAIDLGEIPHKATNVVTKYNAKAFATTYTIQVSEDKENWIDLESVTVENENVAGKVTSVELNRAVTERYIRFYYTGYNSYAAAATTVSVLELEVMGTRGYNITFAGGEEAEGVAPQYSSKMPNTNIVLPQNTFAKTGCLFTGWEYEGIIYQPGETFTITNKNVTFTAAWSEIEGFIKLDSSEFRVHAESEETVGEMAPATYALDGNTNTFWHSQWYLDDQRVDCANNLNNGFIIDLGSVSNIAGIGYLPRQNNSVVHGRILEYKVYYSTTTDGADFVEVPNGQGYWNNDSTEKTASFDAVNARRILIDVVNTSGSEGEIPGKNIAAAEFYVYSGTAPTVAATSVVLKTTKATLNIGDTLSLTQIVSPANANNKAVTWTSSNNSIAVVSGGGIVSAISAGTAMITVATLDGDHTATCTVTVVGGIEPDPTPDPIFVSGVTINVPTGELLVGGTKLFTETIAPNTATNKAVRWSSSDEAIAVVSDNGNVSALAPGKVTILVTTVDGGYQANYLLTILPKLEPEVKQVTITAASEIGGIVTGTVTVKEGSSVTLSATPDSGYVFAGWYRGTKLVSTDSSFLIINVKENETYTAKFTKVIIETPTTPSTPNPIPTTESTQKPTTDAIATVVIPGEVTSLKASSSKTTSVKIEWAKVNGATSYVIYRNGKLIKEVTNTSFTDVKLKYGTTYKYRVKAKNSEGIGTDSKTIITATVPKKPVFTLLKASKTKVKITWMKGTNATNMEIYMKIGSGSYKKITSKSAAELTFTKTLVSGNAYTFKIRSVKKLNDKNYYGAFSVPKKLILK